MTRREYIYNLQWIDSFDFRNRLVLLFYSSHAQAQYTKQVDDYLIENDNVRVRLFFIREWKKIFQIILEFVHWENLECYVLGISMEYEVRQVSHFFVMIFLDEKSNFAIT